eukprot:jgi/Ulvmu1/12185/UM085_0049.1
MIATTVSTPRFARANTRNVTARDSARVFTDAEWEQALSRAAAVYRDAEAAPASSAVDSEVPAAEGRVFADSVWEDAMKKAPLLLKELDRVEEIARTTEAVEGESEDSGAEGRVFTPAQWDAAIRIAVATEKALSEKASIDARVDSLKMQAAEIVPQNTSQGPSVTDVMAFSGPAPEIVNGRLAMLGMVAAIGSEVAAGKSVAEQFAIAPTAVVATAAVLIVASLIPLFKGADDGKSIGPFTPGAELTNSRAAMIGFAALLILEATHGGASLV